MLEYGANKGHLGVLAMPISIFENGDGVRRLRKSKTWDERITAKTNCDTVRNEAPRMSRVSFACWQSFDQFLIKYCEENAVHFRIRNSVRTEKYN
jgi:hypothetical protein